MDSKEIIIEEINKKEQEKQKIELEINELKLKLKKITDKEQKSILTREEKVKIFMSYFRGRDDVYPYLSINKNNLIIKSMER